ncbi:MAG: hypothetical protein ACI8RZ_007730 [Myxococcota bacterium]
MMPLLLTLLTLNTWARDHPAAILPVSETSQSGLILVVGGELDGSPSAQVDSQAVILLDDGVSPDAISEDGVFSALVVLESLVSQEEMTVAILAHDTVMLWEDTIPAGSAQSRPLIKALVSNRDAAVQVSMLRLEGGEGPPSPPPTRDTVAPPAPPSGLLTTVLPMTIALVVGGLLGGMIQRRRSRRALLVPVMPLSRRPATLEVWSIPQAVELGAVAVGLATQQLSHGPVLLVPCATSRQLMSQQGHVGMVWLASDRPETRQIVQAVEALSSLGRPVAVIEGLEALEEPVDDEAPDALLIEIRQSLPCMVIVLVSEGTALQEPPTCIFTAREGSLVGAAGRFEHSETGWMWLPAS